MCAWAHRETTRHLVICKSVNVPRSIPRGQINSSTSVVSCKQIPRLIYAFAAWHSHVQGYSWNLPSASNPFSTFYFFSYSSYPFSFFLSLSLAHALPHLSLPLSSLPSLLSSFVHAAWVSQMEWLEAMAVMQNRVQINVGLPQWK